MVESIYFLKPAWCGTHFAGLWPEQGLQPVTGATALRRWSVTCVPRSFPQFSPGSDWAESGLEIPRLCPVCPCESIIGHSRRRKQAHDEEHDWIGIRRGLRFSTDLKLKCLQHRASLTDRLLTGTAGILSSQA